MYGNFSFYFNSEIVFGKDTEKEAGKLVKKHGGTNVMIVYGSGSVKKSGLFDRVAESLTENSIMFTEFGGVRPNPLRSYAEAGVKKAMGSGVDFVLGVGGGSVIDTAKAIAYGAANDGDFWQFYTGKTPEKMLPVGTIVTIAAAGSETSRSSVIVDDVDSLQKKGLWSSFRPCFAIMNPELTYSLPSYQTAAGCSDIFSHTFMRYFSNYSSFLGDRYGEATMKTIVKYAPVALSDPENYEARAEILLAGSLSHSDLMMIGRPGASAGGEHALESQLSGFYDTTHGAGLAVMMPALLKYFVAHGSEEQVNRVAMFAKNVFGITPVTANDSSAPTNDSSVTTNDSSVTTNDSSVPASDSSAPTIKEKQSRIALAGIDAFTNWLKSIGMPTTLSELGVPEEDIADAVGRCMAARGLTIDGFLKLDEAAVTEIYKLAQ